MLNLEFKDAIFDQYRKYSIRQNEDKTISLEDQTTYLQVGSKINALVMNEIVSEINRNTPVGEVKQYAGETAPNGYLLCQGQAVSRTTYANLFNVIGTKYGNGDGSTTFNLPDLRGRVPVGLNTTDNDFKTLGTTGGSKTVALTLSQIPAHNHSASTSVNSAGAHNHSASSNSTGAHTHTVSGSAASGGYHSHMQVVTAGTGSVYSRSDYNNDGASGAYPQGIQADQAGTHTHTVSGSAASNGAHSHTITVNSAGAHNHSASTSIGNSGGGAAHNNLQPYIVLNYIIKY